MSRNYDDWLQAYVAYASYSEAPPYMHFWSGVSAIAGCLQRKVWIDQRYFKWHANHYILIVAPPGIVSKSTTATIAMDLLKAVPGVQFGPDIVTWPALVEAFERSSIQYNIDEDWHTQCALTLESSELGNLVNPAEREMIDLLVTLWDSKTGAFKKSTKTAGNNFIENPWINLIACTTPAWIAGNFPEYMIGGGFTSRCLFVYAEKKDKLVAYPYLSVPKNLKQAAEALVQDLEHISELKGAYHLTDEAIDWGTKWYSHHYANPPESLRDERFGGYLARKQTHIHKLAMVLAASCRDELIIEKADLYLANQMISNLEIDMPKVFSKIGRTEESLQAEKFIKLIETKGTISYADAYRLVHLHFPHLQDFEGVLAGAVGSGQILSVKTAEGIVLKWNVRANNHVDSPREQPP